MRKNVYGIAGVTLIMGALLTCGAANEAAAGVNLGINVNLGPPPIVAPAPPEVVMVPGSQVYFVPGLQFDVFFYNGYWWSPRGDRWYRATAYNGPWNVIGRRYVPGPVFGVPHDYRRVYAHERHIPYGEWRGHRGGGERHGRGGESHDRGEHRGWGHER